MSDDFGMEGIKQLFLEESQDGLDTMEAALLRIESGDGDFDDDINEVFRAIHSLKGGSATFAFTAIAEFTHGIETLLDEIRAGERPSTPELITLFLDCLDALRVMLEQAEAGDGDDRTHCEELSKQVQNELDKGATPAAAPVEPTPAPEPEPQAVASEPESSNEDDGLTEYQISVRPAPDQPFDREGPARILEELQSFGQLSCDLDPETLPPLAELKPEALTMGWLITLKSDVKQADLDDFLAWLDDGWVIKTTTVAAPEPVVEEASVTEALFAEAPVAEPASDAVPETVAEPEPTAESKPEPKSEQKPAADTAKSATKKNTKKAAKGGASIRVDTTKIDTLINLVGELVITQSMLNTYSSELLEHPALVGLRDGLQQLERNARELQESVMQVRMQPIAATFQRFPRLVHDLCRKLDKEVELDIVGQETELDKIVLEKISDPLVHLVRNALDHGIESKEDRVAKGKPAKGSLTISASHEAGKIVIRIIDDGGGIPVDKIHLKAISKGLVSPDEELTDQQVYQLIFAPGFSTADQVSDVSGRGVGMDVVRRNIQDMGGRIEVRSEPNKGSSFIIYLPLTLAIMDGQLVKVGSEIYIIPMLSIIETIQIRSSLISVIGGEMTVYSLREEPIPIILMKSYSQGVRVSWDQEDLDGHLLVVVESEGKRFGLVVDELLEQQQVVIKSLENNYGQVDGLAGATILGDGSVALILDIPSLVQLTQVHGGASAKPYVYETEL